MRNETSHEKSDLNEKMEAMRLKHDEAITEITNKKTLFERDNALKN